MAEAAGYLQPANAEAIAAQVLVKAQAGEGTGFALDAPISFWGGVDPATAMIVDVRHPQHGMSIKDKVLLLPGTIGSSSASAVLLELIHRKIAPAALVLHEPDAILLLGILVAREMGWPHPPAFRLDRKQQKALDGAAIGFGCGQRASQPPSAAN